jgi:hypothetical protein
VNLTSKFAVGIAKAASRCQYECEGDRDGERTEVDEIEEVEVDGIRRENVRSPVWEVRRCDHRSSLGPGSGRCGGGGDADDGRGGCGGRGWGRNDHRGGGHDGGGCVHDGHGRKDDDAGGEGDDGRGRGGSRDDADGDWVSEGRRLGVGDDLDAPESTAEHGPVHREDRPSERRDEVALIDALLGVEEDGSLDDNDAVPLRLGVDDAAALRLGVLDDEVDRGDDRSLAELGVGGDGSDDEGALGVLDGRRDDCCSSEAESLDGSRGSDGGSGLEVEGLEHGGSLARRGGGGECGRRGREGEEGKEEGGEHVVGEHPVLLRLQAS